MASNHQQEMSNNCESSHNNQNGQGSPVSSPCSHSHEGVKPVSTKRKVVTRACNNCKRLHAKCSNERPCTRCGVNGLACIDAPRKKRQPRNKALVENFQMLYNMNPQAFANMGISFPGAHANQSNNSGMTLVMTELADTNESSGASSMNKQVFEKALGLDKPLPGFPIGHMITHSQSNEMDNQYNSHWPMDAYTNNGFASFPNQSMNSINWNSTQGNSANPYGNNDFPSLATFLC